MNVTEIQARLVAAGLDATLNEVRCRECGCDEEAAPHRDMRDCLENGGCERPTEHHSYEPGMAEFTIAIGA